MRTTHTLRAALAAFALMMGAALSASAADAPAIPNRTADIKPGEWVLMSHVSPDGVNETSKATITGVDGDKITLLHEQFDQDGKLLESNERTMDAAEIRRRVAELANKASSVTEETLVVKEQELPVVVVQWASDLKDEQGNAHEYRVWLAESLPVTGLAKFWSSDPGIPSAEILDFGFGDN